MDKRELIKKYTHLFDELNVILCTWDPYGLSRGGAIADEWSEEATSILAKLGYTSSLDDVIDLVQKVFSKSFDESQFPRKKCELVGMDIYKWWAKA